MPQAGPGPRIQPARVGPGSSHQARTRSDQGWTRSWPGPVPGPVPARESSRPQGYTPGSAEFPVRTREKVRPDENFAKLAGNRKKSGQKWSKRHFPALEDAVWTTFGPFFCLETRFRAFFCPFQPFPDGLRTTYVDHSPECGHLLRT